MKRFYQNLLLLSLLLMAGCNDTPLVEEESTNTQRTFTLSASMPGSGGPDTRVAAEQKPNSKDILLKWKADDKIQLYFDDGSNIIQGEEVVVHDISADGKTAQFDVNVPQGISNNFDLYGVHGTTSEIDGSAILLNVAPDNFMKLEDARVPLYFIKEDFDGDSPDQTVTFNHLGALQVITIKNFGNEQVTLETPYLYPAIGNIWYYDVDGGNVPVFDIVSLGSTSKGGIFIPESFEQVNISPNDNIKLAQWIMPIENASPPEVYLMVWINGVNYFISKDPRGSQLEIGKAYHLYLLWDGNTLSFTEEVSKITMMSYNKQLKLNIDAAPRDQAGVWIDLNNNGVRDPNEDVTFGEDDYVIPSKTVTLYGEVTSLSCSNNMISELDVTKNPALTVLDCSNNMLWVFDVTKNPALTVLDCSNNLLGVFNVTKNPALTVLECSNNMLLRLNVSKNPKLTILSCYNNSLTALDVSNNTGLKHLECYMNKIEDTMGDLIDSLPGRSGDEEGLFYVIDTEDTNEGNVCTAAQAQTAITKNWRVLNNQDEEYPVGYGRVISVVDI